ncbi:MAG: phenylacetate-CoA oxygenase subunit PaaC [Actinobacteria bacterium]|nr:phenylacetate-CoA oxygenase subunit PaaC [Actinomycetota bacterium]
MSTDESAYQALIATDSDGDARWAFGTGFHDPLAGIDTSVPDGIDGDDLSGYCQMLGDDALVMSHRFTEWCTHAPELEAELALANIALDLLGQARMLLARAGHADGTGRDEDQLAFFRADHEFRNVRLAEVDNGDFAHTMVRLLVFSTWRLALCTGLRDSADPVLAAIAAKAVNELRYHRDYAAGWVVRLGDGTDESRRRMRAGLEAVWPLVDELFAAHAVERRLAEAGVAVDPADLRDAFDEVVGTVLEAARLDVPDVAPLAMVSGRGGRDGAHTEAMGYLVAELQSVARQHPEATW